ncbi:MAG: hypothetical protein ABI832_20965, partial [bacterium]
MRRVMDAATDTWANLVKLENRATAKADVVVNGNTLYVSTHKKDHTDGVAEVNSSNFARLYR